MPLLLAAVSLLLGIGAEAAQSLGAQRETLRPEVLLTMVPVSEIAERHSKTPLEHDTEVARAEKPTIVVTIAACEPDGRGRCNASADVTVYRPDGSVHSEAKGLSLEAKLANAPLTLTPDDATGLYKVVAIVRDLNGRRFGTAERSFGVK